MIMTGGSNGTAALWEVPSPVGGDEEQIEYWVHVVTGLELDGDGPPEPIKPLAWSEQRRRSGGKSPTPSVGDVASGRIGARAGRVGRPPAPHRVETEAPTRPLARRGRTVAIT